MPPHNVTKADVAVRPRTSLAGCALISTFAGFLISNVAEALDNPKKAKRALILLKER